MRRHEFYASDSAKAGVLLVRLIKNHPLVDGNKRTALLTTMRFLELAGYSWSVGPTDAFEKLLAIAAGEMRENAATRWMSETAARIP
ncbi:MAG: Fic family protein [Acidobacteria bacterium]|nr:Fic family protein [Acidobacteriota bacterium]